MSAGRGRPAHSGRSTDLGRDTRIGRSTSGLAEAQQAVAEGADLVGVGPMFVGTKDKPPVGPAAVGMVASAGIPHLAIGGVDLQNIDEQT